MTFMSEQGRTKEQILKLISEGNNNLSEISKTLELAPSTVSKHLHDLEVAGAIEQKNFHVKKWKYYKLNHGAHAYKTGRSETTINRRIVMALTIIGLLTVITGAYLYTKNISYKTVYIPISITDPPQVPTGTQALYINYSSLSIHVNYRGSSNWLPVNASGRIDLMSLINESQIIGGARVNLNSTVDMVEFYISYASITIDDINYDVHIPSNHVTAEVDNNKSVNESSNILLDFSPVVTPVYVQDSIQFVLLPTLRAMVVPNPALGPLPIFGNDTYAQPRYTLQQPYRGMFSSANANLTITNVTVYTHENTTSFEVALSNNGKSNVTVLGIILYGNEISYMLPNMIFLNDTVTANMSRGDFGIIPPHLAGVPPVGEDISINESVGQTRFRLFRQSDSSIEINASAIYLIGSNFGTNSIRIRLQTPISNISIFGIGPIFGPDVLHNGIDRGFIQTHSNSINFIVNRNSTLSLPSPQLISDSPMAELGYALAPHSTAIFLYKGELRLGGGRLLVTLPNEGTYKVVVITDEGITQTDFTSK